MIKTKLLLSLLLIGLLVVNDSQAQTCSANIALNTPTSDFTPNGDGTATHAKTGLTWMRCSLGQTWSGATCTGNAATHNWKSAMDTAQSTVFAGFSDWRIPNLKELVTIAELGCHDPSINETVFPATSSTGFWSSTPSSSFSGFVWFVNFNNGGDNAGGKDFTYRIRLVRAGQ